MNKPIKGYCKDCNKLQTCFLVLNPIPGIESDEYINSCFEDKNIEKEKIICAAIWYKDLKLKKPEVLDIKGFRPVNCDKGIVFSGWRHGNCLYQMVAITGLNQHQAGEEIQGFLTNKNRFVDRKEGSQIHIANGDIFKCGHEGHLDSGDLY